MPRFTMDMLNDIVKPQSVNNTPSNNSPRFTMEMIEDLKKNPIQNQASNGVGVNPAPTTTKPKKNTSVRGNIDLSKRPQFEHADGSVSTIRSMSFNENGKEILIPTVDTDKNGNPRLLSNEQAIERYHRTGEHLGKFDSIEEANKQAQKLHEQQQTLYKGTEKDTSKKESQKMEK